MDFVRFEELLVEAFPTEPRPDVTLHQSVLADDTLSRKIPEREWREAKQKDAGKTWRTYSDPELISCEVALAHLPEEAFVYYLPAFLRFASKHTSVEWPESAWQLFGSVMFSVTSRSPYNLRRLKKLSSRQREAVVTFLEAVTAESTKDNFGQDAEKALQRYWKTEEAGKPFVAVAKLPSRR
jgi:hypothetical protein